MKTMKISIKALSILVLIVIGMTSCKKEVEAIEKAITMNVIFKMSGDTLTMDKSVLITPNTLQFTSGHVVIREIVFDGDHVEDGSVSITHEQVSTIDLVTGIASPEIAITIPSGTYNSVNLGVELQDVNSTPCVVTEGSWTNADGIDVPVKFEFNSGEVFEANASTHTFESGASPITEISFDPNDWFSIISQNQLNNAEVVNGVLLINESYNSDIFDLVADELDNATQATFN